MQVFSNNRGTVRAYGPVASVDVNCGALGGVIGTSWLLTNLHIGAREILDVRQCFNDVSFIYAMGNNQSQCTISLTLAIFIGRENCTGNSQLYQIKNGLSNYKYNRISNDKSPTTIQIGMFSTKGYLTGIDVGPLDIPKGVCYATVHFLMAL